MLLASQWIYTSFKNGEALEGKGYRVYSKSTDITDKESEEIQKMMLYKAPAELPYTPTKEEIDAQFPINFSYFHLSSGRVCFAKSRYLGQDYTNRWGNYIIHAFVFEPDKIIPANYINSKIYKESLTEAEQNSAAPISIPQVDLSEAGTAISANEVSNFLSKGERTRLFKELLNAVIDSIKGNAYVNLYEEYNNLESWIKCLSLALPRSFIKKFFYQTYTLEGKTTVNLSCIWNKKGLDPSEFAFSLEKIYHISAYGERSKDDNDFGLFVHKISDMLLSDYYEAVMYINDIDRLLEIRDIELDLAYKIVDLLNQKTQQELSLEEIKNIISVALECDESKKQNLLGAIIQSISANSELQNNSETIKIYHDIYPHLQNKDKDTVLAAYAEFCYAHVKNEVSEPAAFYNEIRSKCPCNWDEAVRFFLSESYYNKLLQQSNLETDYFLVAILCDAYISLSEAGKRNAVDRIRLIVSRNIANGNFILLKSVFLKLRETNEDLYSYIYLNLNEKDIAILSSSKKAILDYLAFSTSGMYFWRVLQKMLKSGMGDLYLYLNTYLQFRENNKSVANDLVRDSLRDEALRSFINMADLYNMCKEKINNKEEICEKYLRVIKTSLDVSIKENFIALYLKNVEAFLSEYNESQQFQICSYIYEKIFSSKRISVEDIAIFSLLTDKMFKGKSFKNLSKSVKDTRQIARILQDSQTLNIKINEIVPLYLEGEFLAEAARDGKLSKDFINSLEKDFIFFKYEFTQDVGNNFVDTYLHNILSVFLKHYEVDFISYLEKYVAPLAIYSDFKGTMVKIIEPVTEETYKIIVALFNIIFDGKSSFRNIVKDVIDTYLQKIGGGKSKKLFATLIDDVDDKLSMEQFAKDYEKQNEPIISKIFGKLFGRKNKD